VIVHGTADASCRWRWPGDSTRRLASRNRSAVDGADHYDAFARHPTRVARSCWRSLRLLRAAAGSAATPGRRRNDRKLLRTVTFASWRRRARAWRLLPNRPPEALNIIYILADDLGYAEQGFYGQEKIRTPHIDRLAAEGIAVHAVLLGGTRLRAFGCCLLTASIRATRSSATTRSRRSETGNSRSAAHPPEKRRSRGALRGALRDGGRRQVGAGPAGTTGDPTRRASTCSSATNCQVHAHSYYPAYLWENGRKVPLDNDPPIPGHAPLPPGRPARPSRLRALQGQGLHAGPDVERATRFIARTASGRLPYFSTTLPHVACRFPTRSEALPGLWTRRRSTAFAATRPSRRRGRIRRPW